MKSFLYLLITAVFFLCFLSKYSEAQTSVKGRVVDEKTMEPLAFVTILVNDSKQGFLTDIDGNFNVAGHEEINDLTFSYVGYKKKYYKVDKTISFHNITMEREIIDLEEVVIFPGINPAHRIVKNAMNNRNVNNPENLSSYSYTAYNKFILTSDHDLIKEKYYETGDSSFLRLSEHLNEKYFFITESVSNKRFKQPDRHTEEVIANRVSGLKNPIFSLLASQLQSFSFYDNFIRILNIEYVSPLAPGSFSQYNFEIKDTLFTEKDSVFVISFEPAADKNFAGMKGFLYINNGHWAVQNVIAKPAVFKDESIEFSIQQQYELVDDKQWFPVQLNTDVTFYVSLDGIDEKLPLYGQSRSYLSDIVIEPKLTRKDFSPFEIDYAPGVNAVSDDFWNKWRLEPLSEREAQTYTYVDSIGEETGLENRLKVYESLIFGDIKLGKINLAINSLYNYNVYERHRLGLGLSTNSDLSERLKIGGHYAYGLGDKDHKYSVSPELTISKCNSTVIGYKYEKDVYERGGVSFLSSGYWFMNFDVRDYYVKTMDVVTRNSIYLESKLWRNFLTLRLFADNGNVYWNDAYEFHDNDNVINSFGFFEIGLKTRLAYGEQHIRTPGRIYIGTSNKPVVYFNITRGFDDIFHGEFEYTRMQSKFDYTFSIPYYGKQSWRVDLGWINNSELPLSFLFTPPASNPGINKLGISSPGSFGTMLMDEFVSDSYAYLFFEHNFKSMFYATPFYSPEVVVVTNIAWGGLNHKSSHYNVNIKSLEKGFYESGIRLNKLFPEKWIKKIGLNLNFGAEVLFRYGPYSFNKTSENFAYKLSFNLLL